MQLEGANWVQKDKISHMGIKLKSKGHWSKTRSSLNKWHGLSSNALDIIRAAGARGVEALSKNTPLDSGLTASSWSYEIEVGENNTTITWLNSNLVEGSFPVAIMLQYGHGTGTGGYVAGQDYINPAIQPIFDNIADTIWKVVKSS